MTVITFSIAQIVGTGVDKVQVDERQNPCNKSDEKIVNTRIFLYQTDWQQTLKLCLNIGGIPAMPKVGHKTE